jgi:hypothetical protein
MTNRQYIPTQKWPPTLDLLNALTAAQEIAADPSGRNVRKLAKQIIEDCSGTELEFVRSYAEEIRETSSRDEREVAALRIVGLIEEELANREDGSSRDEGEKEICAE